MENKHWQIEKSGGVARLRMNGDGELNILNAAVLRELGELAGVLAAADDVRAVTLFGAGKHFSAGMDPDIIHAMVGQDRAVFADTLRELQLCIDAFENLPQPIVAGIRGFCIGGGMILASCCDLIYADDRAIFALPEVKRGIGVIMGAARIARLVGMPRAKEWILLGDRFKAHAALEGGFLNGLTAPADLEAKVESAAVKLSRLPREAVQLNKRILNEGRLLPVRESQELEIRYQAELLDSPEFRAAIEGFLEK